MKHRLTAGLLGCFLGWLGAHKFYLGKPGWGIAYLLFSWTYIPGVVGFLEGISYLIMSDEKFDQLYNGGQALPAAENKPLTLENLKKLYDQGLITEGEYEQKRRKLLGLPAPVDKNAPVLKQMPLWVWLSAIPFVGGLAVTYAGWEMRRITRVNGWLVLALPLLVANFVGILFQPLEILILLAWPGQIIYAIAVRKPYLIYTSPKGTLVPTTAKLAAQLARVHGTVDINNASKDDLVNYLGIPIAYANVIQQFQKQGICFEDLEHLKTLTGIPKQYVDHLAPILSYGVRYQETLNYSWHRLNTLSVQELQGWGLPRDVAEKVVQERERGGRYGSVLEVTRRTGLSLSDLGPIL